MRKFPQLETPTVLLYIFLIFTQTAEGFYSASRLEQPAGLQTFVYFGFLWLVGWWMRNDSRKRKFPWPFDLGLFLYLAWPILVPYYLIKTRGARGLLVILGFTGAALCAIVVGVGMYLILAPAGWPSAE